MFIKLDLAQGYLMVIRAWNGRSLEGNIKMNLKERGCKLG
jgi:hypothetical protein